MATYIRANNKRYEMTIHASRRAMIRELTDDIIIATLENGTVKRQPHETDIYEYELDVPDSESLRIIKVVVDEENGAIVIVIDDSDG